MSAFRRLAVPPSLLLCLIGSELQGQSAEQRGGATQDAPVTLTRDTVPRGLSPARDVTSAYERGAILLEPYSMGDRLLEGKDRRVLANLNDFATTRLADILARSPKAADEARVYDRNHRSGAFMMLAGIIGMAAGGVASQLGNGGGSYPLWIGGTLLIGSGSVRMNRASHALPRAVWWYNHDLVAGN
jgi:hypothetical protein